MNFLNNLNLLKQKNPLIYGLIKLSPIKDSKINRDAFSSTSQSSITSTSQTKTLFWYGIEPFNKESSIIAWLKKDSSNQLIFFEDNLEALVCFLKFKEANYLLNSKQVEIYYCQLENFWTHYKTRIENFLSNLFEIHASTYYLKTKMSSFNIIKEKLTDLCIDQNIKHSEYSKTSPLFYENFLHQLSSLLDSSSLNDFENAFENIPAIICAAGPSLNKAIPILEKLKNKALIFAGGSALAALSQNNFKPHLAIGVDPFESHYENYLHNTFFDLPLIHRYRMNYKATSLCFGEKILTKGHIGYPIVDWIESELGFQRDFFHEGNGVVNFSIQAAQYMGCNPIILVGSDLAYADNIAYSASVSGDSNLPKLNNFNEQDYSLNKGLEKNGNYTLWKWVQEAKWISQFAEANPKTQYINVNSSGIEIEHLEKYTLELLEEKKSKKSHDIQAKIFQVTSQKKEHLNLYPLLYQKIEQIKKSLLEALNLSCLIKQKAEQENPLALAYQHDFENTLAYQYMLKIPSQTFNKNFDYSNQSLVNKQLYLKKIIQSYLEAFEKFDKQKLSELILQKS